MKLILSRKGFDSATGKVPSPIFPDGSMVSLPIPSSGSKPRFCDIRYNGSSLGDLAEDLTERRVFRKHGAHLDPDLREPALTRMPGWRPLFGQASAAQAHLDNKGVGVGDLFLFFGWFRFIERTHGKWTYVSGAPHLHVLFGWLQVGQVIRTSDHGKIPPWARYHPHFRYSYTGNNTVYAATESLCLDGLQTELAGGGAFERYDDALCLTAPGCKRSVWELPGFFYPEDVTRALTYHQTPKCWDRRGDKVRLQTVGRGQEFVLDTADCPEAVAWAQDLIAQHAPEQSPVASQGGPFEQLRAQFGARVRYVTG